MKNLIQIYPKGYFKSKNFITILLLTIILFSCYREGEDGEPGRAYLSLSYFDIEPSYIDIGNTEIPQTFFYDEDYRVHPGWYTLYYEVSYTIGRVLVTNAYEVDYEIWINLGEPGDVNYDGRDGEDTYFEIELYPDGPEIWDNNYKSAPLINNHNFPMKTGEVVEILKTINSYHLKITYRKVEPRK